MVRSSMGILGNLGKVLRAVWVSASGWVVEADSMLGEVKSNGDTTAERFCGVK